VILFQGFNTSDATNIISLLSGFVIILLGVYIINLSRTKPQSENQAGGDEEALLEEEETLMLRDIGRDGCEDEDEDTPRKPHRQDDDVRINRSSLNRL
jgi:hypothetical protein